MKNLKIAGLTLAALATLGASTAYAAPGHHARPHKPHKVCKIVKTHGHGRHVAHKKVCRWVR